MMYPVSDRSDPAIFHVSLAQILQDSLPLTLCYTLYDSSHSFCLVWF